MEQKSVFISYRRAVSKHLARSIYQDLTGHGWDAFFDVNSIDSGDFDRIILNQIAARAHFILIISPGSMERCVNTDDWVRREIEEAVRLERNIVPIIEENVDLELETGFLPEDLRTAIRRKNSLPLHGFYFEDGMEKLRTRFLKAPEYITVTASPPADRVEIERRMATADAPQPASGIRSIDLLPAPFSWIDIPGERLFGKWQVRATYKISKYPVTNAQFRLFVDAGGYRERRWWTEAGWAVCESEKWIEPEYWSDGKWNGTEQPVVGVSWYEAVAFCLWLGDTTSERIMLPTEIQWLLAAEGNGRRNYPWGSDWDRKKCNNSVSSSDSHTTTPVRTYEGIGDSPFGVVDMAGNVREWCLTGFEERTNDIHSVVRTRVTKGGSWNDKSTDFFRCEVSSHSYESSRNSSTGFRIVFNQS